MGLDPPEGGLDGYPDKGWMGQDLASKRSGWGQVTDLGGPKFVGHAIFDIGVYVEIVCRSPVVCMYTWVTKLPVYT